MEEPFIVLATQNPIEQEGTYPLPEAQVDRFMLKVVIDYPKMDEEQLIMRANLKGAWDKVNPVVSIKQILSAQEAVREVYMDEKIGAVGGNVKVRNADESLCARLQAIEYLKTISVGRIISSQLGIYKIISGAFGAFRADVTDSIKGWDIGPGLDGDITVKIRKSGYKIYFQPEAVCLTNAPSKFKILTKQRLRWDKSIIRFRVRKHKDVYFPHQGFSWSNFFALFFAIFIKILCDCNILVLPNKLQNSHSCKGMKIGSSGKGRS